SGINQVLVIALMAVGLWVQYFIAPSQVIQPSGEEAMPLWNLVFNFLSSLPLLGTILSAVLIVIVVVVMIRFNTSVFFIARRTYFPALFYIMLYSSIPRGMVINPALPAALLILAGLWRMMSAYRLNGVAFNFFDAALLVSSAGMFYAPSVWFVLLVLIGVLVLRSPDFREISITLAGALLPWVVLYAVWYITGGNLSDLTEIIQHNLFDKAPSVYWSRTLIILLVVIAVNFIPGLLSLLSEMSTKKIKSRKTFELLLWMLAICAAAYVFLPSVSTEMNAIAAIPVAFIMANYCAFTRRLVMTEILFWIMVAMIVISRIWPN
ncbi:MAG: DUF6427 family protein, partial [Bacteroidales bacterium]